MQLEDYFDFLAPDDIRLKGHRIGVESILYEYIHRGQTAEQIVRRFETLSLEQVHATILYYLRNKESVGRYLADWLEYTRAARQQSQREHADWYERMRQLKVERKLRQEQATPS